MKTKLNSEDRQINQLAEAFRESLPEDFFRDLAYCEFELARGNPLPRLTPKGSDSTVWSKLRESILIELNEVFCSTTSKYAELRRQSKVGTHTLIIAVAGYISAKSGISLAVVTGAVAFTATSLLRVGVNSFCRAQGIREPRKKVMVTPSQAHPKRKRA